MKITLLTIALLSLQSCATAFAMNRDIEQLVPQGKIVELKHDEKKVQTTAGTIVEIEYRMTGDLKEASGDAALGGDVLEPAGGLLTLHAATEIMKNAGKTIQGDWSFEKSFIHGWVYEFEGSENNQKMDYLLDAKTGKILKAEIDH